MTLGLNLLGLDQIIRADKLLKPPMLLAFQLDQLKLMKLLGQLQLDHINMPLPPPPLLLRVKKLLAMGLNQELDLCLFATGS